MNPGKVGVWLGGLNFYPASVERETVAEIEELGYGALWIGEATGGKEVFGHAAMLLGASNRIVVATGIASIWARDAMSMDAGARTLGEAFPDRFLLGLGVSHSPLVSMRGQEYNRPISRMRAYLEEMDAHADDYFSPSPAEPVTRVLAALRPRMLELAAELTDGAHPYFVPVEHTARARAILGPDRLLLPEQAVLFETDPSTARRIGRAHASWYLTATNYVESLRSLGWGDEDFANGGSDALIDAIVAWGDEDAILARVKEHFDAGADHVAIQPLPGNADGLGLEHVRRLAPALTSL